jgi:hypothetical protein
MTYDALSSGSSERRFIFGVCGDKEESLNSHDPPYRHQFIGSTGRSEGLLGALFVIIRPKELVKAAFDAATQRPALIPDDDFKFVNCDKEPRYISMYLCIPSGWLFPDSPE